MKGPRLIVKHENPKKPVGIETGGLRFVEGDAEFEPDKVVAIKPYYQGLTLKIERGDVYRPKVTMYCDPLSASIIADCHVAKPIPEYPNTRYVRVEMEGVKTRIFDAQSGEELRCYAVEVKLMAGEQAMAWIDCSPEKG